MSRYAISLYAGENINTADLVFEVAEKTDSSVVMRLPFAQGGFLQQKYTLAEGSYMLHNELSFVGIDNYVPRNVTMFDSHNAAS